MMIRRDIEDKIKLLSEKFPIVTLTGIRQAGKSTFLRLGFPNYKYVSLEDLDFRQLAESDPRGFLNSIGEYVIIDEAQRVPSIFSYIQGVVDAADKEGLYILSGSHNFLLMESVTQSLAGRAAVMKMQPFSVHELVGAGIELKLNDFLYTGGFPRIYDKEIAPSDYYSSYVQTYIERDVRQLKNISNMSLFMRFLKLCAARIGQLLNVSSLANECGITNATAQSWLSILETSYVIYLLKPYYKNYNKRLIKNQKLYFCDTGLAAYLLGMNSAEQMELHYMCGEFFENMVVMECVKQSYSKGIEPNIYFWRDSNLNEVDLLVERGLDLYAYEIKSGATINPSWTDGLRMFKKISDLPLDNMSVIYGGDMNARQNDVMFSSWKGVEF